MGIRRRRRKLTSLMSRLDQRVRSVELRPISLLTSEQVSAAVEIGAPAVGPETVVSASAPYQFIKVQDGYIYPKALTGLSSDRVELYTEAATGAVSGEKVEVSGIHWASSNQMDVTGDNFTLTNVDEPNWADRPSYKHDPTQDQLSGVTISHAYELVPESVAPQTWTTRRRLQTRRKVDSFEITAAPGSTVTLTMNATHHFEVGDIIFVDIFSESSQAYGVDGLFEITAVTGTTIEYVLTAGVDVAVSTTDVSSADIYVFPVIREWAQDGSIWVDSSNNETYYWDGIRWVEYTPGAVAGDGDPPSPPTSFSATSEINYPTGSTARVQVSLSWTAPTTSVSGNPITDLYGYLIKWRPGTSGDWKTYDLEDADATSFVFGEVGTFSTGTLYSFELYAKDSGGEISTAATTSVTTPTTPATNITTVRPAALTNDPPYLGTVTLYWDGTVENTSGVTQTNPAGLYYLEIHKSTNATFTASASTLIGTVTAIAGAKFVDGSLSSAYGSTFYYRAVLVDGNGTSSLQSDPPLSVTASSNVDVSVIQGIIDAANITPGTIVTGEEIIGLNITGDLIRGNTIRGNLIEANSVTADQIDVGNLTAQIISTSAFTTRASGTSSGITIDNNGITAFNGSTPTFYVDSSNGHVTINSGMTIGDVTAAYNAANTAQSTADSAASTANSAASTASSAASTASSAASDASSALSDIANVESAVYYPGTTQINGGNIRTGTLVASAIGAGTLQANVIYGGNIDAENINAGTITGSTLRTSSGTGKRVIVSGSSNTVKFWDSGDDTNYDGIIEGSSAGLRIGGRYGVTQPQIFISGTTVRLESPDTNDYITCSNAGLVLRGDDGSGWSEIDIDSNITFNTSGAISPEYFFSGTTNIVRIEDLSGTTISDVGTTTLGTLYRTSSDERLKKNIADSTLGLSFINSLRPVTFKWKPEEELGTAPQYGLIAQEVATALEASGITEDTNILYRQGPSQIFADYVTEEEPAYGLQYQAFVPSLIKAIQELSNTVTSLQTRIETLEGN